MAEEIITYYVVGGRPVKVSTDADGSENSCHLLNMESFELEEDPTYYKEMCAPQSPSKVYKVDEDRFDKAILALKARKKFIDGGILPASMCDIKHLALML
jgi:hypothetical protein